MAFGRKKGDFLDQLAEQAEQEAKHQKAKELATKDDSRSQFRPPSSRNPKQGVIATKYGDKAQIQRSQDPRNPDQAVVTPSPEYRNTADARPKIAKPTTTNDRLPSVVDRKNVRTRDADRQVDQTLPHEASPVDPKSGKQRPNAAATPKYLDGPPSTTTTREQQRQGRDQTKNSLRSEQKATEQDQRAEYLRQKLMNETRYAKTLHLPDQAGTHESVIRSASTDAQLLKGQEQMDRQVGDTEAKAPQISAIGETQRLTEPTLANQKNRDELLTKKRYDLQALAKVPGGTRADTARLRIAAGMLERIKNDPKLGQRVVDRIQAGPVTDRDLRRMGISDSIKRRQVMSVQIHCDTTFREYGTTPATPASLNTPGNDFGPRGLERELPALTKGS